MKRNLAFFISFLLTYTLILFFAFSQEVKLGSSLICGIPATKSDATRIKSASAKEVKNALLIANSDYGKELGALSTPVKEARNLKRALESIGFNVIIVENANRESMEDALLNFREKCQTEGGIAFFHYGGHAVQIDGVLYLIPVSANITNAMQVRFKCVNITDLMDCMQGDANIVVFDTARNTPFPPEKSRETGRSNNTPNFVQPRNSIIFYSTESGTATKDGIFTPILTCHITEKNKSASDIFKMVCLEVSKNTEGKQNPCMSSKMLFHIYLAGEDGVNRID